MARTSKLLRSVLVQPVDNIGTIARATQKGDQLAMGEDQHEAFVAAENLLQSDSLLVHFDQDILLACNASPYGVGAVLSHQMPDRSERPIAFASRSLSSKLLPAGQRRAEFCVWGYQIPSISA